MQADLAAAFQRAAERRRALAADPETSCYRLVNAGGDGVPGVTVDRFGDVAVMSLYEDLPEAALADAAMRAFQPRGLYVKRRPREARVVATTRKDELAPSKPLVGEDVPELTVRELGLRYLIRPGQGLSVGLYLDMRETRAWLRGQVRGRTLLNCFAYTCGFGLNAVAGGAARAVNIDLSRRVLDWGADNARLNGQSVDRRDYIAGDVMDWLGRFARKGEAFGVVVLDPPSFSTAKGKRFSAARDYPKLAAAAARVVEPGGLLLACCNLAELPAAKFEALVTNGLASAGRDGRLMQRLGPSAVDFPGPAGLKILALSL